MRALRAYPLSSTELVDDVVAGLDAVTAEVERAFGALSTAQLAWQPSPEKWGVGHCLVHLARSAEVYRKVMEGPLGDAATARTARGVGPDGTDPLLRGRWFGRFFTRTVGPGGMKVKAPSVIRPRPDAVQAGARERFLDEQRRFRDFVSLARGVDLDAVEVRSPIASWVRLTAGDALRVVVAHEWRHVAQAERVLAAPGFPG